MALYAVSITKRLEWQGRQEEYDNTYYYEGPLFQAGDANFSNLIDEIVAAERPIHGSRVAFVRGRLWSAGGTPAQNETLVLKDLTGVGSGGAGAVLFGEAAAVVEWECARKDIKGRKVYLKKFIRPGNALIGMVEANNDGRAALGAGTKAAFKTYADRVQNTTAAFGPIFILTSPGGRVPRSPANGVVNDYLRSREFRRN